MRFASHRIINYGLDGRWTPRSEPNLINRNSNIFRFCVQSSLYFPLCQLHTDWNDTNTIGSTIISALLGCNRRRCCAPKTKRTISRKGPCLSRADQPLFTNYAEHKDTDLRVMKYKKRILFMFENKHIQHSPYLCWNKTHHSWRSPAQSAGVCLHIINIGTMTRERE